MKVFWAIIVCFMTTVWFVNANADAAGLGTPVAALAAAQREGQVLVSERQFDQRSWVAIRLARGCPATLIVGSSTIGTLASGMFSSGPVLNAWLTGPLPEDFEALTGTLQRLGCRPGHIVAGIDGFMLNDSDRNERWRSWEDARIAYQHRGVMMRRLYARAAGAFARIKDGLAYETTRDSVRILLDRVGQADEQPPRLVADDAKLCTALRGMPSLRHADGHFSYCGASRPSTAERQQLARTYVSRDFHHVRSWSRVSMARVRAIEGVVAAWRAWGARVVLVTPPYNPLTYAAVSAAPAVAQRFAAMDEALARVATRTGAVLLRARNPAELGCSESDFYDSHHFGPACASRLALRIEVAK